MAKKPKKKAVKSWLISHLRRISRQWPPKNQAKVNARIERGKYLCAHCEGIFGPKDISLDHIEPVVPLEDYTDLIEKISKNRKLRKLTLTENDNKLFEDFFKLFIIICRLFIQEDRYQVLCSSCHDQKTKIENEIAGRDIFKKKNEK